MRVLERGQMRGLRRVERAIERGFWDSCQAAGEVSALLSRAAVTSAVVAPDLISCSPLAQLRLLTTAARRRRRWSRAREPAERREQTADRVAVSTRTQWNERRKRRDAARPPSGAAVAD